ncbi:transglycosylase domain-containing protein [Hansschlegelia quercus]|uniref:Biosynthetic peptidoglycan transglycosylase n=1 Tax=Hansschlegelia quercus TaxID=2528245 RepID=A0A4Q9GCD2_9HYPH|nr:transglycosylase domain-containing protein [Hansschlegelia quercus]TBN47649.1 monofunctional biosynthetic peptidoglycan transglycosylase [Hansschlegelia quercus]
MAFLARSSTARLLKPRLSPLGLFGRIALVLVALPFLLTLLYSVVPPVSTLMIARWATLRPVERVWTPIDRIAPALPQAVLVSEDARFCSHHGVDWGALRGVFARHGGPARGASTIPMQVAKNLFLWQGAPYLRKPLEIVLAHWIDLVWTKRRVMEVYLNIAEWGPNGVFGAEAGARRAFGRSAGALTPQQAARMAAALPNPVTRDPKLGGRQASAHAAIVAARARGAAAIAACLR